MAYPNPITHEEGLELLLALRPFAELIEDCSDIIPDDKHGGVNLRVSIEDVRRAQELRAKLLGV